MSRLIASPTGMHARTHSRWCFWRAFIAGGVSERARERGCSFDACDVAQSLLAAVSYRLRRSKGRYCCAYGRGICRGPCVLSGTMVTVLNTDLGA
jgi:hypothetical protein